MPKICVIPNCRIADDDPEGRSLSFFKLPSNESLKKKWLDTISQHFDVQEKKTCYICSLHFEEQSIKISDSGYRRVKKNCCPTLFLPSPKIIRKNKIIAGCQISIGDGNNKDSEINDTNACQLMNNDNIENINTENFNTCRTESVNKISTQDLRNEQTISQSENETVRTYENFGNESLSSSALSKHTKEEKKSSKQSLCNIDLSTISYSAENQSHIQRLLERGQLEIRSLRQQLKRAKMQLYRSKKRVASVKSLFSHLKDRCLISEDVSTKLEESIPDNALIIFNQMLRKKQHSKETFPPSLKSFATTLQLYSPKAYNYVREIFLKCLPHPQTIKK